MTAPSLEKVTEQPTQPLPIAGTEHLPPGGNWLMSEHSVLLIPAVALTAVGVGEVLRTYVVLDDPARSNFSIVLLVGFLVLDYLAFAIPKAISRGKDGRS